MSDNVVPLRPNTTGYKRLEGKDYTTPSRAIYEFIKHGTFDQQVIDKGWIELKIIAKFSKTGAMFHTVNASQVMLKSEMSEAIDNALPKGKIITAIDLLRSSATLAEKPRNMFLAVATSDELEKIDELLLTPSDEAQAEIGELMSLIIARAMES